MCLQLTLAVGRDYVPEGKEFQSPFEADVFATSLCQPFGEMSTTGFNPLSRLMCLQPISNIYHMLDTPGFQSPFEADVFATLPRRR